MHLIFCNTSVINIIRLRVVNLLARISNLVQWVSSSLKYFVRDPPTFVTYDVYYSS